MRFKRILKNMISEILPQIIIAFLGIYKSKIFLDFLGANTVGLYQLFAQILGYLSLVEGGLGTAVTYQLYKPIYNKDYEKLGQIRNGIKRIFNIVIITIFILAIFVGFIIPFLIKDNVFSTFYIVANFLLYVVSELLLYRTVFERSMFTATEKNYKLNIIVKTTLILKSILEVIMAIYIKEISYIFIMFIIINLISNIIVKIISKREFKFIQKSDKKDYSILKNVKSLLVHKIAGVISSNIDIVILASFSGLGKVVVYSTYLLYESTIISFMNKISNAFLGSIGNKILEDKEDSYRIFKEYNALLFFLAIIVGGQFFFSIDYFINIWYTGNVETTIGISILFSMILIYNIIRIPLITFTESAGLFKETRKCPIIEAIINLVISLILIKPLGIEGLLIGTLASLVISEFFIKPNIILKNIYDKKRIEYYKLSYKFIIIIFLEIIMVYFIKTYFISINNLISWILYSAIFGIINIIIVTVLFTILKQDSFIRRVKNIFIKNKQI